MVISKLIKFVNTLITLLKSVRLFLLLFLLFKKVGSARLKDSGIHPISPNTSAPQYKPVDRKKRKGKRVEFYSWDGAAYANKEASYCFHCCFYSCFFTLSLSKRKISALCKLNNLHWANALPWRTQVRRKFNNT